MSKPPLPPPAPAHDPLSSRAGSRPRRGARSDANDPLVALATARQGA